MPEVFLQILRNPVLRKSPGLTHTVPSAKSYTEPPVAADCPEKVPLAGWKKA